jgi:hypothetical protein
MWHMMFFKKRQPSLDPNTRKSSIGINNASDPTLKPVHRRKIDQSTWIPMQTSGDTINKSVRYHGSLCV